MSTAAGHAKIAEVVKALIEQRLGSFWTACLARIEEIDQVKCRAKVKPLVKLPVAPDRWEELPVLLDIPIDIARAGPFYVRRPYKEKDIVVLVILSHSLERVLHDHEPHEPGSIHLNNLNDCVVLGGFRADTDGEYPTDWQEDLIVQNADTGTAVVFHKDGKIDIFVEDDGRGISLNVITRGDLQARSAEGKVAIQAAEKIELGNEPRFRVVLGEKLLAWLNSHVHIGVQPGDANTGPPAQQAGEDLLSKLVWVRESQPGALHFPRLQKPGELQPTALPPLASATSWLSAIGAGTNIPPVDLAAAIAQAVDSIGQALANAVGEFIENPGEFAKELGEEVLQELGQAIQEVLSENWLQLLGMLVTNPAGALVLLAEKLTAEVLERIAGTDILSELSQWITKRLGDLALDLARDVLGVDNLPEFLDGVKEILDRCLQKGEITLEEAVREALNFVWEKFGQDGVKALVALVLQFVAGG